MVSDIQQKIFSGIKSGLHPESRSIKRFIGVAFVLLAIYFLLIAASRYVSESKLVVVRSGDSTSSSVGMSLQIPGLSSSTNQDDTRYLKEYLSSAEVFEVLDKKLDFYEAFQLQGLDLFSMLPRWTSKEFALDYYRNRVELSIDDRTGILTVRTQGFSPDFSLKFNQAILQESERFINELSYRMAREQLDFANKELARARKGLDAVKDNILPYQEKRIDPMTEVGVTSQIVTNLEGALAVKEAELRSTLGLMNEGAPLVIAQRQAILGLKEQIRHEKNKLTSTDGDKLNRRAVDYIDKKSEMDFQTDLYKIALSSFEKTRIETIRKMKNVAVIASPQLPDRAEYPRRFYSLLAGCFLLVMLYAFLRLIIAVIEDHRD